MKIEFKPVGIVHSPFKDRVGTPIQPSRADGTEGEVEIFPEFAEGLADLDGFSHIIVLYHLHRSEGYRLKVVPYLDTVERGLFATRSPNRPNPIGLSVVELKSIEENRLKIENVDMLDGTPVIDIKPYVGEFDLRTDTRFGWFESVKSDRKLADGRFED